jgi:hypothetical protein
MTQREKLTKPIDVQTDFSLGFVNIYLFHILLNESNKFSSASGDEGLTMI